MILIAIGVAFQVNTSGVATRAEDNIILSTLVDTPAATHDVAPDLVELLRSSYGPLIDSVSLRPLNVNQSRAKLDAVVINYTADGFIPFEDILVAMDRAGVLIQEQTVQASADGVIAGSFLLEEDQTAVPGTITVIAVPVAQIEDQFDTMVRSLRVTQAMEFAAAAIEVTAAPRLVSSVTFEPATLIAGRPTTATYTVKNFGDVPITLKHVVLAVRGPDCDYWCEEGWADWPGVQNLTLPAGASYTVSTARHISQPGAYIATVAYQDVYNVWRDVEGSTRFNFTVQPGIVIEEPLTMTPADPLAGEVVRVRFRVRNASNQLLTLANVVADGRGPDCDEGWVCPRWAATPGIQAVQLGPGETYTYEQSRAYAAPGRYFLQPLYQFTAEDWHHLGERKDFRVGNGIEIVAPLRLNPPKPATGYPVQASYTVRNAGHRTITIPYLGVVARGPDCGGSIWECDGWADWPWIGNVTLGPGEAYTYNGHRQFDQPGVNYWAEPQFADFNPWWMLISNGQGLSFPVEQGLTLIEPLSITPSDPVVGELITARAVVKNNSSLPIDLKLLFAGAQGPDCVDFTCTSTEPTKWNDFPGQSDLRIEPGQQFEYRAQRMWLTVGDGYVAQLMYLDSLGGWHTLGDLQTLSVGQGLTFQSGLAISPSSPQAGELYTGRYTLRNNGPRPLTLPAVGVGGTSLDCDNDSCQNSSGMAAYFDITIPPGGTYDYVASRSIDEPNHYYAEPFVLGGLPDWWMPLTPLPGGNRVTFTVGDPAPPDELLPCTMTIERGANFINSRFVDVSINVPEATEMLVSNDGGFIGAVPFPYTTQFDWALADLGTIIGTLVVRVRAFSETGDLLCNGTISDEIIYDAQPPSLNASYEGSRTTGTIRINAEDQVDGSGVAEMQISSDPAFLDPVWITLQSTYQTDALSAGQVYLRVRDRAGNLSNVVNVQIGNSIYIPVVGK